MPGMRRLAALRSARVQLQPARPPVVLLAREIGDPAQELPLVGELQALPPGETAAYVSEGLQRLYGAHPVSRFDLPLPNGRVVQVLVRGVWRDYAHQHGAVTLHAA